MPQKTKKEERRIDLKNQSDSLCYQSEKQLKELGDKVNKEDKTKIEDLIKQLRAGCIRKMN